MVLVAAVTSASRAVTTPASLGDTGTGGGGDTRTRHGDTGDMGMGDTRGQGGHRDGSSRDRIAVTDGDRDTGDVSVAPSQSPPSVSSASQ